MVKRKKGSMEGEEKQKEEEEGKNKGNMHQSIIV